MNEATPPPELLSEAGRALMEPTEIEARIARDRFLFAMRLEQRRATPPARRVA
ncbi:MAG: hypothetical protein WC273_09020 [Dehalococcoidia bacterium]